MSPSEQSCVRDSLGAELDGLPQHSPDCPRAIWSRGRKCCLKIPQSGAVPRLKRIWDKVTDDSQTPSLSLRILCLHFDSV